jgi:hypothetical protein
MYYELRNIIEGIVESPKGNFIQTALFYLRKSETTSRAFEKSEFVHKKDEVENLIIFANERKNVLTNQSVSFFIDTVIYLITEKNI